MHRPNTCKCIYTGVQTAQKQHSTLLSLMACPSSNLDAQMQPPTDVY